MFKVNKTQERLFDVVFCRFFYVVLVFLLLVLNIFLTFV